MIKINVDTTSRNCRAKLAKFKPCFKVHRPTFPPLQEVAFVAGNILATATDVFFTRDVQTT